MLRDVYFPFRGPLFLPSCKISSVIPPSASNHRCTRIVHYPANEVKPTGMTDWAGQCPNRSWLGPTSLRLRGASQGRHASPTLLLAVPCEAPRERNMAEREGLAACGWCCALALRAPLLRFAPSNFVLIPPLQPLRVCRSASRNYRHLRCKWRRGRDSNHFAYRS
jgi:hypothetical protein